MARAAVRAVAVVVLAVTVPACGATPASGPSPDGRRGVVRILIGGDVMLGRGVADVVAHDPWGVFFDVQTEVRSADIAIANLESPLTRRPHVAVTPNALEADPAAARLLAGRRVRRRLDREQPRRRRRARRDRRHPRRAPGRRRPAARRRSRRGADDGAHDPRAERGPRRPHELRRDAAGAPGDGHRARRRPVEPRRGPGGRGAGPCVGGRRGGRAPRRGRVLDAARCVHRGHRAAPRRRGEPTSCGRAVPHVVQPVGGRRGRRRPDGGASSRPASGTSCSIRRSRGRRPGRCWRCWPIATA